jgi:hypothetical protein
VTSSRRRSCTALPKVATFFMRFATLYGHVVHECVYLNLNKYNMSPGRDWYPHFYCKVLGQHKWLMVLRLLHGKWRKPRPESGPDWLVSSRFVRQRGVLILTGRNCPWSTNVKRCNQASHLARRKETSLTPFYSSRFGTDTATPLRTRCHLLDRFLCRDYRPDLGRCFAHNLWRCFVRG